MVPAVADSQVIAPPSSVCVSIIQMLQRLASKTPSKNISTKTIISRTRGLSHSPSVFAGDAVALGRVLIHSR
jgi:hypothetical protein